MSGPEGRKCPIREENGGDGGVGCMSWWCGVHGCEGCFDPTWCYVCDKPENQCSDLEDDDET